MTPSATHGALHARPRRTRRVPARFRCSRDAVSLSLPTNTEPETEDEESNDASNSGILSNQEFVDGGTNMDVSEFETEVVMEEEEEMTGGEMAEDSYRGGGNVVLSPVAEGDASNLRVDHVDTPRIIDAPNALRNDDGASSESVQRVSYCRAEVSIRYSVTTAVPCPCEDSMCTSLVNVGRWGRMGGGSRVCVHCKHLRKGGWLGAGFGFMGTEDLVRHLKTSQCQASRGLDVTRASLKKALGDELVYAINNPVNKVRKRDGMGSSKEFCKCPRCHSECLWRSRFAHCVNCFPLHDREGEQSVVP